MAITLSEAAKLSNDALLQGVIETIIKECPLLQLMPFIEIVGNALTYNRESALPAAEWHASNDDWATSPSISFSQQTATLKILGQNADVDNYIKQTRSNIQDVEAAVIEITAKAVRHELEDKFVYGDNSADANQFDGLIKIIDTATAGDELPITHKTRVGTGTLDRRDQRRAVAVASHWRVRSPVLAQDICDSPLSSDAHDPTTAAQEFRVPDCDPLLFPVAGRRIRAHVYGPVIPPQADDASHAQDSRAVEHGRSSGGGAWGSGAGSVSVASSSSCPSTQIGVTRHFPRRLSSR